jgi:hypothetical protein
MESSSSSNVEDDLPETDLSQDVSIYLNPRSAPHRTWSKPKPVELKQNWVRIKIGSKYYYHNNTEKKLIDPNIGYERTIYQGETKDGIPHGKGIWYFSASTRYEGQFENGNKSGEGKIIRRHNETDETEFDGTWKKNVPWSGFGKFIHTNGDTFIGSYDKGCRVQGTFYSSYMIRHGTWTRHSQFTGIEILPAIKYKCKKLRRYEQLFSIETNKKIPNWFIQKLKEQALLLNQETPHFPEYEISEGHWKIGNSSGSVELFTGQTTDRYIMMKLPAYYTPSYHNVGIFTGTMKSDNPIKGTFYVNEHSPQFTPKMEGEWDDLGRFTGYVEMFPIKIPLENIDISYFTGKIENDVLIKGLLEYPSNKGKYIGEFKDLLPNGAGEFIDSKGNSWIGNFVNNVPVSGKGYYQKPNGAIIQGEFENGLMDGKGSIFSNKVLFIGTFKDGKLHGEGEYRNHNNGCHLKGYFENGNSISGTGRCRLKNGALFEGTFTDSWKNFNGSLQYANHSLKGTFIDSRLHGECEIEFKKNGKRLKANFNNGLVDGTLTVTYADGTVKTRHYTSDLSNTTEKKFYIDKNGNILKGLLNDYKLEGLGLKILASGTIEKGSFKNNELDGEARKTYYNGIIDEGHFKDGLLDGHGIKRHPDGRLFEGNFLCGYLHGEGYLKIETDDNISIIKGHFIYNILNGFVEITTKSKLNNSEKTTYIYSYNNKETNFIMDSLDRSTCKICLKNPDDDKEIREISSAFDLDIHAPKYVNMENLRKKPAPFPVPKIDGTLVSKTKFLDTAKKYILEQPIEPNPALKEQMNAQETQKHMVKQKEIFTKAWENIAKHLGWIFDELFDENNVKKLPDDPTCELIITYLTAIERMLTDESINFETKTAQITEIAEAKTTKVTCRAGFLAKLVRIYQKLNGYNEGYEQAILNAIHSTKDQFINSFVNDLVKTKRVFQSYHIHAVSAFIYHFSDIFGMDKNLGEVDPSSDLYLNIINNPYIQHFIQSEYSKNFHDTRTLIQNVHFYIHENTNSMKIPQHLEEFNNVISEYLKKYKPFQKPENEIALADEAHILSNHFKDVCRYSSLQIGSLNEEQYERSYEYALHDYIIDTYFEVAPSDDLKSPIGIKEKGIEIVLSSMRIIESLPQELSEILEARQSGQNQSNFTISSE